MTGRPLDHRQRNIEYKAPGIICKERIEMPNSVNPIPDDYRGAIPYLNVNDGIGAAEFYKKAFGASERIRILRKDGKRAHGELKVGEATIVRRCEIPERSFLSRWW